MSPTYRRLITQTSSLSGSSGGSAISGNAASPVSTAGGGTKSPLQNGAGPAGGAALNTGSGALDSSAATVVSANSHATGHSSIPVHHHHHHSLTTAGGIFMNPAATAAAQSLQQARAANAAIAAAHVQHHAGAVSAAAQQQQMGLNFVQHNGQLPQQRLPQVQVVPGQNQVARGPATSPPPPSAAATSANNPTSDIFKGMQQRRGKWTQEEEMYAHRLIKEFENGSLTDCENGATLRSYLSRKLHCAPMRISKKFAGKSIGKHVFLSRTTSTSRMNPLPGYNIHNSAGEPPLRDLELRFYHSLINDSKGGDSKKVPSRGYQQYITPSMPPPSGHNQVTPQIQYAPNQMFHIPVPAPQATVTRHPALIHAQAPQPAAAPQQATASQVRAPQPASAPQPATALQAEAPQSAAAPLQTTTSQAQESQPTAVATSGAQASDHDRELRESFLSALKQSEEQSQRADEEASSNKPPQSQQPQQAAQAVLNKSTTLAQPGQQILQNATASNEAVNTKPVTSTSVSVKPETNRPPEDQIPSHAELPEFLSGFEKMASAVSAHMPLWPTDVPANQGSSFAQFPPTPTFTSKSFDELHQYLGNGLSSQHSFQLNNSNHGGLASEGKALVGGPATDALFLQHQTDSVENARADGESKREPQQAPSAAIPVNASVVIPQSKQFCADAYAVFAQQSALAVSQHSAYCNTDDSKLAGHELAAAKNSFRPGQVAPVQDNASVQGWKGKDRSAPDRGSMEGPLPKRARVTTSAPPNTFTPSMHSALGRHANIISGSERSESESAIGSSRASSSGSASEEADDNASDNASDQSESSASSSSAPAGRKVQSSIAMDDNRKANEMGYISPSSAQ